MARLPLTITNPDAETGVANPVAAPWISAVGSLASIAGSQHSGANCFANGNNGAWDYYQDVAIPGTEYAGIDAGLKTFDYTVWMKRSAIWNPTHATSIIAMDAVNAPLQTWSFNCVQSNYERCFLFGALPVGTRNLRFRFQGTTIGGASVAFFDDLTAGVSDRGIFTPKVMGYAVTGLPDGLLEASKVLGYATSGPGGSDLVATKVIAYAVIEEIGFIAPEIY